MISGVLFASPFQARFFELSTLKSISSIIALLRVHLAGSLILLLKRSHPRGLSAKMQVSLKTCTV